MFAFKYYSTHKIKSTAGLLRKREQNSNTPPTNFPCQHQSTKNAKRQFLSPKTVSAPNNNQKQYYYDYTIMRRYFSHSCMFRWPKTHVSQPGMSYFSQVNKKKTGKKNKEMPSSSQKTFSASEHIHVISAMKAGTDSMAVRNNWNNQQLQ